MLEATEHYKQLSLIHSDALFVDEAIFWEAFCEWIEICSLDLTAGLMACSQADGWMWAFVEKQFLLGDPRPDLLEPCLPIISGTPPPSCPTHHHKAVPINPCRSEAHLHPCALASTPLIALSGIFSPLVSNPCPVLYPTVRKVPPFCHHDGWLRGGRCGSAA